jgi:hypothetical protein
MSIPASKTPSAEAMPQQVQFDPLSLPHFAPSLYSIPVLAIVSGAEFEDLGFPPLASTLLTLLFSTGRQKGHPVKCGMKLDFSLAWQYHDSQFKYLMGFCEPLLRYLFTGFFRYFSRISFSATPKDCFARYGDEA